LQADANHEQGRIAAYLHKITGVEVNKHIETDQSLDPKAISNTVVYLNLVSSRYFNACTPFNRGFALRGNNEKQLLSLLCMVVITSCFANMSHIL